MIKNKLLKNFSKNKHWLIQSQTNCFRLYDKDIPEYPYSIEFYSQKIIVYEYEPQNKELEAEKKDVFSLHRKQTIEALTSLFGILPTDIYWKIRKKQKGNSQYEKLSEEKIEFIVEENGLKFLVNLKDYLDTGLFLDNRRTRLLFGKECAGKNVLNLFCYTGSASVYAHKYLASSVTSIDMNQTYLSWAERNFQVNNQSGHIIIRADVLEYLKQEEKMFDLVFLDPPSFSNSKKMTESFDVQRDHEKLVMLCHKVLKQQGKILFSNNYRKFSISHELEKYFKIQDISALTLPPEYRNKNHHHTFWLTKI
jgi:23S rRNA (cytosine1962-C5)-methyltransferase